MNEKPRFLNIKSMWNDENIQFMLCDSANIKENVRSKYGEVTEDLVQDAVDILTVYMSAMDWRELSYNIDAREKACSPVKEMSLDEIEEALGYRVNIKGYVPAPVFNNKEEDPKTQDIDYILMYLDNYIHASEKGLCFYELELGDIFLLKTDYNGRIDYAICIKTDNDDAVDNACVLFSTDAPAGVLYSLYDDRDVTSLNTELCLLPDISNQKKHGTDIESILQSAYRIYQEDMDE